MRIGAASAGGFSTAISAGTSVMLVRNATIMPQPAISPSSDRPRYEVGTNEKKPSAVATPASASGPPALRAALSSAGRSAPVS